MEKTSYDIVVVGAGASGLMCALLCARKGRRVLLVEKESQPGRKILVSGNGRCNLTNAHVSAADYRGDISLAAAVLKNFSFQQCLDLFHSLGVLTREEENGRVFPLSGKSTAVAEALRLACLEAGVELRTDCTVTKIHKKNNFILTLQDGSTVSGKKCVLACGSCAYPQAGGTELGYQLARSLGHTIIRVSPSLCGLCVKEKAVARLQGIRAQVKLTAFQNTSHTLNNCGEVLFTNYGLSGPVSLNISGPVGRALANGPVLVEMDILPEITAKLDFLRARIKQFPQRNAKSFFAGLLHENIANLLIDFTGLRKNIPVSAWTENTLQNVARALSAWPLTVTTLRPWTEAMVATGGVNCAEINYNSLESVCCPGLYILGELLNVDGRSGGFNLHFAWGCAFTAAAGLTEE